MKCISETFLFLLVLVFCVLMKYDDELNQNQILNAKICSSKLNQRIRKKNKIHTQYSNKRTTPQKPNVQPIT